MLWTTRSTTISMALWPIPQPPTAVIRSCSAESLLSTQAVVVHTSTLLGALWNPRSSYTAPLHR